MKSAGYIATYMSRQDWKGKKFLVKLRTMFSNLCLFLGQLAFLIVGTAYGKIRWPERLDSRQTRSFLIMLLGVLVLWGFVIPTWFLAYNWWIALIGIFILIIGLIEYRCIRWRWVWRAAQCSHVRLCLKKKSDTISLYINFGYPKAELQYWRMAQCRGKRFRYFDPTFTFSQERINSMIQYARDQEGKRYDELQLISTGLHLIAWIVYPWCWGKELKIIKALNRPGGCEHCTSGFVACLRWGEREHRYPNLAKEQHRSFTTLIRKFTRFFKGYDTAVVLPCLVPLSEEWRRE